MIIFLRLLDITMLPRRVTKSWSLYEYFTYFWVTRLQMDRIKELEKAKRMDDNHHAELIHSREFNLFDQSTRYWFKAIATFLFQFTYFNLIPAYFKVFKADWNPKPFQLLDFTNLDDLLHYYLFTLQLYISINLSRLALAHIIALLFQFPYRQQMIHPWMATSLQEFWGSRWNLTVQSSLKRIAFDPMYTWTRHTIRLHKNTCFLIATLSVFCFSAFMHEWLLIGALNTSTLEQSAFFLLHALLLILETLICKVVNVESLWARRVLTHLILIYTVPLMLNPYIRNHVFLDLFYPFSKVLAASCTV